MIFLFLIGLGVLIVEGSNKSRLTFLLVYPVLIAFPLIFNPVRAIYPLLILNVIFYLIFSLIFILPGTKEGLKELRWNKVCEDDNIESYQEFLSRYPEDIHYQQAKNRINQIENEQQSIQETIKYVLLKDVNSKIRFSGKSIHISTHLLTAYSSDDTTPLIRGAYGSQSALISYVSHRIAEIYKAVFGSVTTLKIDEVTIEC